MIGFSQFLQKTHSHASLVLSSWPGVVYVLSNCKVFFYIQLIEMLSKTASLRKFYSMVGFPFDLTHRTERSLFSFRI